MKLKSFFYLSLFLFFLPSFLGCAFISMNLGVTDQTLRETQISGEGKDKILLIDLSGIISQEGKEGVFRAEPSMVSSIKEQLEKASKDEKIKGIILRIDSPGGEVTASDIIYHELITFKQKTGKKIIASIMDLGASGAYYIAMGADKVVSHPTSIVGSIGVVMVSLNVEGLFQKIGIGNVIIKSGDKKDMGSPFRPMSQEERELFQNILDSMHDKFIKVVSQGRNLKYDDVKKLADGRIYTASQAKEVGLIDKIGYLDEAIELAKEEIGIKEAKVVIYYRQGKYKNNIYSKIERGDTNINLINLELSSFVKKEPSFMYLWIPNY